MTLRVPRIFFVVYLCSFSSLAYEIVLTRIFSISLSYHFAFMIISIAMLGLGASGTVLSLYPKMKDPARIPIYTFFLGISISLEYLLSNMIPFDPVRLSWEKAQLLYIGLYYVTLSVPFFFTGSITATAFSLLSRYSGLLYGADLVGAGTGSIGILGLTTVTSPEHAVFAVSTIALMASFAAGGKRLKALSLLFILFNASLFLFHPTFAGIRMSPYKGLGAALRYPGARHMKTYYNPFSRIDLFRSPAVRFAPGLSLRYLEPLPEQIGLSVDGGGITAVTSSLDEKSLSFLGHLPSALAYEVGGRDNALILDPGGGLQVLVADHYGVRETDKVEANPLLIDVMRRDFSRFSGGIYDERTWTGLGRSWLEARAEEFDVIDISLMGAQLIGSFGISEDYRFTVEAFRGYLNHLKPNGVLSINLYLLPPPRIELRLLITAVTALRELGETGIEQEIVAVRSWDSLCILVRKSPFTSGAIDSVRRFSGERRFDLVHYPGIRKDESNRYIRMPSDTYFIAFQNILSPFTRERFIENYLFDITPVRDDRPFFHYFLKLTNIREIYRTMGEKWQFFIEEGYILPALFLQVIVLSLVLIFVPSLRRLQTIQSAATDKKFLPYFAFLGVGYLFVEVALIQKMVLPLEYPPYAVATVLASVLIGSGLG
ncbi:MAG TPA: hypothetical protein VEI96_08870, partial [Thermodesulfovibrionales bacterium]|nr:hypothetical protein [Thermodesulfovibrionales bacterium]